MISVAPMVRAGSIGRRLSAPPSTMSWSSFSIGANQGGTAAGCQHPFQDRLTWIQSIDHRLTRTHFRTDQTQAHVLNAGQNANLA